MNIFQFKRRRLMKPAAEGESGASAADRGDDFVPTSPEEDDAKAAADAAAKVADESKVLADAAKLGLGAKTTEPAKAEEPPKEGEPVKDTRIPLARHEQILAKERAAREALEVQLANTQRGAAVAKTNEEIAVLETKVDTLEAEYAAALAEGEVAKATALMKQIRQTERMVIEQKAEFRTQAATATAIEQVRYETTLERLTVAYPQLVPGHEDFDQGLVNEINELTDAYELKGYAPSAALQKAVSVMVKPVTARQETATTVTPRVDAAAAEAAAAKLLRDTEARKRNGAAADAQPPALADKGANSDEAGGLLDAAKVIKMSFEKFMKVGAVPDDDLARMRGDTV